MARSSDLRRLRKLMHFGEPRGLGPGKTIPPTFVLADSLYEPVYSAKAATNILCLVCGMRSYHPRDIEKGWCGMCDSYHDDPRHRNRMVHAWRNEKWRTLRRVPFQEHKTC